MVSGTLHVIIIPGVGQILKLFFGTPRVNQKWDWAILTHGNCRCDYYKILVFWSKIEKCQHSFQQPDLGLRWDFTPRVSRPDKTNPPPGADFSISPSGFNYDMQSRQATSVWYLTSIVRIPVRKNVLCPGGCSITMKNCVVVDNLLC